jgi:hypothetical protein
MYILYCDIYVYYKFTEQNVDVSPENDARLLELNSLLMELGFIYFRVNTLNVLFNVLTLLSAWWCALLSYLC